MTSPASEQHQIYDRVTRVEAQVASLSASVSSLAETVGNISSNINDLKGMMSSVGKTDGRTIITLGAALLGATVMVGSIFLGPIQRDVSYLDTKVREVASQKAELKIAEQDGMHRLIDWRLAELEKAIGK